MLSLNLSLIVTKRTSFVQASMGRAAAVEVSDVWERRYDGEERRRPEQMPWVEDAHLEEVIELNRIRQRRLIRK